MSPLGPNASHEDILDELEFQHIIHSTLESTAEDYVEQKQRVESIIAELQERLNQASAGSTGAGREVLQNGQLSDPSLDEPLPTLFALKRRYNEFSSPTNNNKYAGKRSRLGYFALSSHEQSPFVQSQRRILERREQEQRDLEFALSLSASLNSYQPLAQPSQPSNQAILNRDLSYRSQRSPQLDQRTSAPNVKFSHPERHVFENRFPQSSLSIKSRTSASSTPSSSSSAAQPRRSQSSGSTIEAYRSILNSASDAWTSPGYIPPSSSQPGAFQRFITQPARSTSRFENAGYPAPMNFDAAGIAFSSHPVPSGLARVKSTPNLGQSSSSFERHTTNFVPPLYNSSDSSPAEFSASSRNPGGRSLPPGPYREGLPYPSGIKYDQMGDDELVLNTGLVSHYPGDATDEISKLLENIRPDEDIPPEQREGTPRELMGILADDMGLGKTIQAIALMVTRPSKDPNRKTTLIVAPVALLRQWEQEIKDKIRPNHALKVFKHHGQSKKSFSQLRQYDVVLTTFGSLAAELKKREKWLETLKRHPNALAGPSDQLSLIGDECYWHRVIVDEAQCIKNKDTKSARAAYCLKAKYRLCMTGTLMMNNVTELYSLIRFCRIRPFNDWDQFRVQIKAPLSQHASHFGKDHAMRRLQGLVRAVMLRRNKKSKLDGRPLIPLPDRVTERADVIFDTDQDAFYKALEEKAQLQFNKYLRQGAVMKNYANVLVLLLRLRQACCHPHLLLDFDESPTAGIEEETREQLAKTLNEDVVQRIRAAEGNFECPICFDAVENPAIIFPCGHALCSECLSRLTDPAQMIASGDEGGNAKCPKCRGPLNAKKLFDFLTFKRIHQPELLTAEERTESCDEEFSDEDSDEATDSNEGAESDVDDLVSLKDFVVDDDEPDSDNNESSEDLGMSSVEHEIDRRSNPASAEFEKQMDAVIDLTLPSDDSPNDDESGSKVRIRMERRWAREEKKSDRLKGKAKKTSKSGPKKTLAQLKRESLRNKEARKTYFRRLRKEFVSSAKLDRIVELLQEIHAKKSSDKVLVFSQFTSLLDLTEVSLQVNGYGVVTRYDGSMKPGERDDAVHRFKSDPNRTVMLVSLKAGNAGLNLNIANHVILLDPFWNPYIEEQAIDRAHRIGQRKTVYVHRVLVPGTVEDRIIALQEEKRELIDTALDEKAGKSISRLGLSELCFLFGVDRRGGRG